MEASSQHNCKWWVGFEVLIQPHITSSCPTQHWMPCFQLTFNIPLHQIPWLVHLFTTFNCLFLFGYSVYVWLIVTTQPSLQCKLLRWWLSTWMQCVVMQRRLVKKPPRIFLWWRLGKVSCFYHPSQFTIIKHMVEAVFWCQVHGFFSWPCVILDIVTSIAHVSGTSHFFFMLRCFAFPCRCAFMTSSEHMGVVFAMYLG